jgi:hypothetical protein
MHQIGRDESGRIRDALSIFRFDNINNRNVLVISRT